MGTVLPKDGTQPENGLPENVHGIIAVGAKMIRSKPIRRIIIFTTIVYKPIIRHKMGYPKKFTALLS
jgi:hypothetical protein